MVHTLYLVSISFDLFYETLLYLRIRLNEMCHYPSSESKQSELLLGLSKNKLTMCNWLACWEKMMWSSPSSPGSAERRPGGFHSGVWAAGTTGCQGLSSRCRWPLPHPGEALPIGAGAWAARLWRGSQLHWSFGLGGLKRQTPGGHLKPHGVVVEKRSYSRTVELKSGK